MPKFDNQTLIDLEFPIIREWLLNYAIGETAKQRIEDLAPTSDFQDIENELIRTNELLSIRKEGQSFPLLDFEELKTEIRLLPVKNAVLSLEGFIKISRASQLCNDLLVFFDKQENLYPLLNKVLENTYFTKEISDSIDKIFDRTGNIKDEASVFLTQIRIRIKTLKNQINRNFDKEMRRLSKDQILGDTKETFLNDRRVLTILASHKRQVSGNVVGSSKTGSLIYMEPQVNIELNNELELQLDEERKEIYRILKILTKEIATYLPLIEAYQFVLTEIDFINAKTKLALELNCNLPSLVSTMQVELIDAFHPILWKSNKNANKKTLPQRIVLDTQNRMLVISGPNAGGKSITLKTIGLLQLMLQSGLLIPVHENSKCCFFQQVLSDIGDNQSIENELSTYSYRLKRMKTFLKVTNRRTLLLLDEFGTGSDPDLGGALAEVFFEELYKLKCFAVITTHYANIKLKADELPNAVNGCMLFDTETLEPLYRFDMGQPGSSFTFEVAQINGIPQALIEQAKLRIDEKKVKLDRLLSDLQKEKTYFERLNLEHQKAQRNALLAQTSFEERKEKYDERLATQQTTLERDNKFLTLGKKMQSFIDKFNGNTRKKGVNDKLIAELQKYVAVEKAKIENANLAERLKKEANKPNPKQKANKNQAPPRDEYNRSKIVIGSTVKLVETKQTGTVEEVNENQITILFGFMRMKVEREKLMWVK